MKQLLSLFLFLLPCLALAQYPSNGNQKITLGEQTTADGLVWRGVAASDTVRKPSIDTMAYMVLDTTTNIIWHYKKATSNAWLRLNLLPSDTASMLTNYWRAGRFSGVLPVANGGTGATSFSPNNYLIRTNSSGIFDTAVIYEAGGNVGIGTSTPNEKLVVFGQASDKTTLLFGAKNSRTLLYSTYNTQNNQAIEINSNNPPGQGAAWIVMSQVDTNVNSSLGVITFAASNTNAGDKRGALISSTTTANSGTNVSANLEFYTNNNGTLASRFLINSNGNIGFGVSSPSSILHLKAGTSTANTAPLKFTSGTNLTTAEAGAMEFNGTNLFFSPSTTRHTVNHGLTGSATLDFGSTNAQLSTDLTITVTGASDGDVVSLGIPNAAVNANTSYSAWVSAANTVTVRFNNYSSGTVNPASGSFKVFVTK